MDESWRKSMGTSSTWTGPEGTAFEPEDFDDVFGGPPRSVLARKMSADFSGNDWFYDEIFKPPTELDAPSIVSGRRLPEFVIPERRRSKKRHMKSMLRSKSTSSSVMSFDEMNELHNFGSAAVIAEEDVVLSSYTSKLRPLNVPSRWTAPSNTMPKTIHTQELPRYWCPNNKLISSEEYGEYVKKTFNNNEYPQALPSLETTNAEPVTSEYEIRLKLNSSVIQCQYPVLEGGTSNLNSEECISYKHVGNEANSHMTDARNVEASNIVEAIAWAKEKFQGWSSNNFMNYQKTS